MVQLGAGVKNKELLDFLIYAQGEAQACQRELDRLKDPTNKEHVKQQLDRAFSTFASLAQAKLKGKVVP